MIGRIFWQGIKVFVPAALTFAIIAWVFSSLETIFHPLVHSVVPPQYTFPGVGILVGLIFILILGCLVNAWVLKSIHQLFERTINRIPVVKSIYAAILDFVAFFEKKQDGQGQQVVLFDSPFGKMVGLVTREKAGQLPSALFQDDSVLVYIPCSYQVGGIMVSMPRRDLTPLDMSVEQAMSMLLTAGMLKQK